MHHPPALQDVHRLDPVVEPIPATDTGPPPEQQDDLRLVSISTAAERLDLSRSKLYELIADGELPTVRIGRARRIALADLRAFVARHRVA